MRTTLVVVIIALGVVLGAACTTERTLDTSALEASLIEQLLPEYPGLVTTRELSTRNPNPPRHNP